jgi:hypothetical protein
LEPFFGDYGRFRGWVYTDVAGILSREALDDDAIEGDRFDPFSVHLAAIGTGHDEHGEPGEMVVGSTRLIVDIGSPDHVYVRAGLGVDLGRLPVDESFPEVAEEIDLRTSRVRCEVSRYAAHGLDLRSQLAVTAALRKATVAHYVNLGGDETFAVVEKPLARNLRRNGVNVYRISEPRHLEHYGSVNFAVVIDMYGLARSLGCQEPSAEHRADPFAVSVEVPRAVG